jgi:lysyl-tRNA synthetase class 2
MEGLDKLRNARIEKLNSLKNLGINPYPYRYEAANRISEIIEAGGSVGDEPPSREWSLAGRIMAIRGHGSASFGHVEDATGRIQFYIRADGVGAERYAMFKLLEVGDIVGMRGQAFRTKTNELTVRVADIEILSKALRPMPEKWHGLTDKEIRYRQRYVDLIMNPEVREVFRTRSRVIGTVRQFLLAREFMEVETPVLQPLYGGAAARPFTTHHNALDMTLYLRIADELYLKRLLVGGYERVFEFAKDFRNEGIDKSHNPEFTMMECYAAYLDYKDYMDMVEELFSTLARELTPSGTLTYGGSAIDFTQPWNRITFYQALEDATGVDFRRLDERAVLENAAGSGVILDKNTSRAKALDQIFSALVEPRLVSPTFVYDYPRELSPLAKDHRSEEGLVERFEPFIAGFEVGNAFSELNDPLEQRKRFEQQASLRALGDDEAHVMDEDYIRALEYGMPPAAGLGLGIDRITMIFTDCHSIRDVLFFPHMRPEEGLNQ